MSRGATLQATATGETSQLTASASIQHCIARAGR